MTRLTRWVLGHKLIVAYAGGSVVFSGVIVAVGLLALVVLPVGFLRSTGFAGMFIPLVSVAVAITLLPVILATAGARLDWPRLRKEGSASRSWTAWARLVYRRKWRRRWPAAAFSPCWSCPRWACLSESPTRWRPWSRARRGRR